VEPFLNHEAWEVRMAAVETLWRLERKPAAEYIFAALPKEKDPHVLSEMLYALARLGHPQATALSLKHLSHERDYVRRQAMRAVLAIIDNSTQNRTAPSDAVRKLARDAAELGRRNNIPNDNWGTPAGWKQRLMALMEPKDVVAEAVAVAEAIEGAKGAAISNPHSLWGTDREMFAAVIAGDDAMYAEYSRQGLPGGQTFVLSIARRRRAPELVKAMQEMIGKIVDQNAGAFNAALQFQRDKTLTRQAFERRAELPKPVAALLPVALENTFGANLGVVTSDWEAWLKNHAG